MQKMKFKRRIRRNFRKDRGEDRTTICDLHDTSRVCNMVFNKKCLSAIFTVFFIFAVVQKNLKEVCDEMTFLESRKEVIQNLSTMDKVSECDVLLLMLKYLNLFNS